MTRLRILHTVFPATDQGNPFVTLMIGALPPEVESSYFSWVRAFARRWDVVHFQWPEKFFASSNSLATRLKVLRFRSWIAWLRIRGTAIVLTVHNLATHENFGPTVEREMRRLESNVDCYISLNPAVDLNRENAPVVTIPHGSYRAVVPARLRRPAQGSTLLYFGFIRPYKNVPRLIDAFSQSSLPADGVSLRVLGKPNSEELRQSVATAATSAGVDVELRAMPDQDLYEAIASSAAVVLPYTQLYNSGAMLMALTLDRPVIAPRTPATEFYEEQFGSDWISLYDGEISAGVLEGAYAQATSVSTRGSIDLDFLDWAVLSEQYVDAYREAISHRSSMS